MAPTIQTKKKAETKKKPAAKAAAKKKPAAKAAARKTQKPRVAAKKPAAHQKRKLVAKAHPKKKAVTSKKENSFGMNEEQKTELLHLIDQVIHNRRHKPGGLRSFFMIDRILDHYNQKYTHPETKFEAIVKYGDEKHHGIKNEHVFVFTHAKEKDETDLYKILSEVNAEKVNYAEVKKRLEHLVEETKTQK